MSYGKVSVNELNLFQGPSKTVENTFMFFGVDSDTDILNQFLFVNKQTDLANVLGGGDLLVQMQAAQLNSTDDWVAIAVPHDADTDWAEALSAAWSSAGYIPDIEAIVICVPVTESSELTDIQGGLVAYFLPNGLRVIALTCASGIEVETESWSEYVTRITAIQTGVAANRVLLAPQTNGNNLGVLAGRLSRSDVSVADSPMRVATGAVLGLGDAPVDKNGVKLKIDTLIALSTERISVPFNYANFDGTYWSDGNMLDVEDGDFQAIENMRVMDKLARRVRVLAIARIANRQLNSTPVSIASNKQYFMRPAREMSKGFNFAGQTFPGDIMPPSDNSIAIQWITQTQVVIWITARPYNSPKDITVNLSLDLTTVN